MGFLVSPTVRPTVGPTDSLNSDNLPWEGDTLTAGSGGGFGPAKVPSLAFWVRGDQVSGTPVQSWTDLSGNNLSRTQTTVGLRPVQVTDNPAFNNQDTVSFDGVVYIDEGALSPWSFLHDGTGMTIFLICKSDLMNTIQAVIATNIAASGVGMQVRFNGAGSLIWSLGNGGAFVITQTIQNGVQDSLFWICLRFLSGRPVAEWDIRYNSVQQASGNAAAAVAPGDPDGSLTLGARPSAAFPFTGDIAECFAYSAFLSDAQVSSLEENYITPRYT